MDRQQVFELIRDRLADILEIDAASISEGQSFADDLEADSLALIELVEALEEELAMLEAILRPQTKAQPSPVDPPKDRGDTP